MALAQSDVPVGVHIFQKVCRKCCTGEHSCRVLLYRSSILILTFIAYTSYHISRKSISVVKNVLYQNCTNMTPPQDVNVTNNNKFTWCDWAPFDGPDASTLLGILDSAFLFAYAGGMFFSGFIAERVNLRYFLTLGMIFSGIFCYLFGIAKTLNIHNLWYFIIVQFLGGIAQTTGWPGVVTVMGNWFGEGSRGLIFGIWNSHTSVGNILGSLIAGEFLETNWSLSFIVPGAIIAAAGLVMFLFLVTNPIYVNCPIPHHKESQIAERRGYRRLATRGINEPSSGEESSGDVGVESGEAVAMQHHDSLRYRKYLENEAKDIEVIIPEKAINFLAACRIPGVIEFALSLFFSKLVSYTFLYWLPLYIKSSTTLSATLSADLSTLFDVGGIVGGIIAGVLSDRTGMSATTCNLMLILAIPMMFIYDTFGTTSLSVNIVLLILVGILVNGPYALITTAVSADLGTHPSLEGNQKALATVTAIIDGTGSIGAAVGPLLAGVVANIGWESVFYMLMVADVLSMMFLSRLMVQEVLRCWRNFQERIHSP